MSKEEDESEVDGKNARGEEEGEENEAIEGEEDDDKEGEDDEDDEEAEGDNDEDSRLKMMTLSGRMLMMSATTITPTMIAILHAVKVMREGMSKGMRLK